MKIIIALLVFSLVIVVHELGHFIFARINGIEVVDFSIGMGPRLCGFHMAGTQFSIRLFPIGGACMMLGEDEDQTMQNDRAFYSKGVWQRISVLFAGPFFNFILAFVLAVFMIGIAGYDPAIITGVTKGEAAEAAGLQAGDEILSIAGDKIAIGREIQSFFDFTTIDANPVEVVYVRNGETYTVQVQPIEIIRYRLGFSYYQTEDTPAEISAIETSMPLYEAGIRNGDVITAINGTEIRTGAELGVYFEEHPLTGDTITFTYARNGEETTVEVVPVFSNMGYSMGFSYNLGRVKATPVQVLKYSLVEVKYWIETTVKSLGKLVTGQLKSNEIGSAVAIVDVIGDTYEASKEEGALTVFLNLAYISILLSANLGVMNLLPIPALDGGKLLFSFIEVVRGKPLDREKEGMVHFIGMVALMILMVFLVFNDIRNVFF